MRRIILALVSLAVLFGAGCRFFADHAPSGNGNSRPGSGSGGGLGTTDPEPKHLIQFTPVGAALGENDLIDLEFLPGQNGEALVISKGGAVFYLLDDFTLLPETEEISVEDGGERGLLNVAADPDYAVNAFIYLYYTVQGISPDLNRVERYTVDADTVGGTFELLDPFLIIQFSKNQSPNPASNNNGGGLAFDAARNLLIAVGDGGGGASSSTVFNISQDLDLRLGKVHRIIPDRDPPPPSPSPGAEHFALPSGQEPGGIENISSPEPSIYAPGLRNPFSNVHGEGGNTYIGDLGQDTFEEINELKEAGENFGWPACQGPCFDPELENPLHGYTHDDLSFSEEDPDLIASEEPGPTDRAVVVLNYYPGAGYDGLLQRRLIYTDFFLGWVRALKTESSDPGDVDLHIGHQVGLTSLQIHPVDGLLYGVSLGGSDQVLKMELK